MVELKEKETIDKYQDLAREFKVKVLKTLNDRQSYILSKFHKSKKYS